MYPWITIRLRRPPDNFRHLLCSFVRVLVFRFFDRPFTPRGCFRSARNFAKTRFRHSRHLIFQRPKNLFDEIFGPKMKRQIKNHSFCRSHEFLSVSSRFSTKNDPISPEDQVSPFLGEGVQRRFSIFLSTFGPKLTYTFR